MAQPRQFGWPRSVAEPAENRELFLKERSNKELLDANRSFYDPLWSDTRLIGPERFNTWPLVREVSRKAPRRIEIGPGLRPRLPIAGTQFVDISPAALDRLSEAGGEVSVASISELPFGHDSFDLVCALDIVEHVDDDVGAMAEISRVAAPGAVVLLSVPLHPEYWTPFDDFVGHRRRYTPERLAELLGENGLSVEQTAIFGMKPKSSRLVNLGMWFLEKRRKRSLWWYNNVFMPLGLRYQKPLELVPGMMPTDGVGEVFLVCRRGN